ncbi:hypothetical protein M8C21_025687 [Ambrosia artemisiifolia]|uniref:Uncharacterized protein n=1 Tax=Ambrosia artemisiifolia TaxID=4212 RepID=A0AAD5BLN9_AMBAR|nr:hypothetical protein M8C21_025687 [Ambrosia artemisiifolia]
MVERPDTILKLLNCGDPIFAKHLLVGLWQNSAGPCSFIIAFLTHASVNSCQNMKTVYQVLKTSSVIYTTQRCWVKIKLMVPKSQGVGTIAGQISSGWGLGLGRAFCRQSAKDSECVDAMNGSATNKCSTKRVTLLRLDSGSKVSTIKRVRCCCPDWGQDRQELDQMGHYVVSL